MINPRKLYKLVAGPGKYNLNKLIEMLSISVCLSSNNGNIYSIQRRNVGGENKFIVIKFINNISTKNLQTFTKDGFVLGKIDDAIYFDNIFDVLETDEIKKTFDL